MPNISFSNDDVYGSSQKSFGLLEALNPLYLPIKFANFLTDSVVAFSDKITGSADYSPSMSSSDHDLSIVELIDNYGGATDTVEAERQREVAKLDPVFNEVIEQRVLALQPFYYGVRLDGTDPAKNVESLLTQADFKEALAYGEKAGYVFGYAAATAIGAIAAVACFWGFMQAGVSFGDYDAVDTFTASAKAATTGFGGLLSILGASVTSSIAFFSAYALAPIYANKVKPYYQLAFINQYIERLCKTFKFESPTKDKFVSLPREAKDMEGYTKGLHKRIKESQRAKAMGLPVIRLGTSTGVFRAAGLQDGLEEGTPLEININDLYTNFCILGSTGSGKTSSILAPVIRQLFIHRKKGTLGLFGMYVSDAKGVFWVDIKQIAIEEGLPPSEVIVIGTGDDQYGVHLTKGVPPELLPALISSIMATVEGGSKGGGGSAFYEGMFNIVATHIAVLLDAYDRSPAGSAFTATEHRSIYCIERMFELLTVESSLEKMLKDLLAEVEKAGTASTFFSKAAADAIEYFNVQWQDIQDETKSNLRATVQKNLGGLMSNPAIKVRFFEGRDNIPLRDSKTGKALLDEQGNVKYLEQFDNEGNQLRFIDVDGAFKGKLVCSSLSTEKGGVGASFTISALTARVKMISTDREIEYKSYNDSLAKAKQEGTVKSAYNSIKKALNLSAGIIDEEDDFADMIEHPYFEPGPSISVGGINSLNNAPDNNDVEAYEAKPLNPQMVPTFLVFDEFQEFAIKGGKNFPLGDDFFWAKNRSKGVIGIVAFQFKSSVEQFMGKEATTTMLGNMRNKIALHTEDVEFIGYLSQLFGKVRRHSAPEGCGYYESQAQKELAIKMKMKAQRLLEKAGAYPDISSGDALSYMRFITKNLRISDGAYVRYISQPETLAHDKYDTVLHSYYDDVDHKLSEIDRVSRENPDAANNMMLDSHAMKLSELYYSLDKEAMDQQSDFEEELVTVGRVVKNRFCAVAYIQSYGGIIKDYYEVKQDHELKAERAEIHAEIAKENNIKEVA